MGLTSVCCQCCQLAWLDGKPLGVGLCLLPALFGAGRAVSTEQITINTGDDRGKEAARGRRGSSCLFLEVDTQEGTLCVEPGQAWSLVPSGRGPLCLRGQQIRSPDLRQLLCPCVKRDAPPTSPSG